MPGVAMAPRPMWNSWVVVPKSASTGWKSIAAAGRRRRGVWQKKS